MDIALSYHVSVPVPLMFSGLTGLPLMSTPPCFDMYFHTLDKLVCEYGFKRIHFDWCEKDQLSD